SIKGAISKKKAFSLIVLTEIVWTVYFCSFPLFHNNKRTDKTCHVSNGLIHKNHLIGLCIIMFLHFIALVGIQCLTFWNLRKHIANLKELGMMTPKAPLNNDQNVKNINQRITVMENPAYSNPSPGIFTQECSDGELKSSVATPSTERQIEVQNYEVKNNMLYYQWSLRITRIAKLISFIFLSFAICYTPFMVCVFLYAIHPGQYVSSQINYIAGTILTFNSLTNVVIYLIRSKEY
ncbi:unnamed protein product, partial [Owenia fusiformis]